MAEIESYYESLEEFIGRGSQRARATLQRAIDDLTERNRVLQQALQEIIDTQPYPEDVFTPLTKVEQEKILAIVAATEALQAVKYPLDRLHAQWARHVLGIVQRIAQKALHDETGEETTS